MCWARAGQWLAALFLSGAVLAQNVGEGVAVLPVEKVRQSVPLFYAVDTETNATAMAERFTGDIDLKVRVLQGRPEILTIGLSGDGEVSGVSGSELASWSVRKESDGSRFLDLKPKLPKK